MKKDIKKEVLKEESNKVEENLQTSVKMREIIIETDGSSIHLKKAEVSGKLEFLQILQTLISFLNEKK